MARTAAQSATSGYSVAENLRRELARRRNMLLQHRDRAVGSHSTISAAAALQSFYDTLALFEQWGPDDVRAAIKDVRDL